MLQDFIKSNFGEAIKIQSSFSHDHQMVESIQYELLTVDMIKKWMINYGLFQGITKDIRNLIANEFINFAYANKKFEIDDISGKFQELHERFKTIQNRKWLSATSKLLWCIEPQKIVIYDAFVERSILILQCLDDDLAKYPRINTPPDARKDLNSELMTKHYMNYQNIVYCLFQKNGKLIENLKTKTNSDYEYNIRIIDKILWIMGNFKEKFVLNKTICKPLG